MNKLKARKIKDYYTMTTDSVSFRHVIKTIAKGKKLGFKLNHTLGSIGIDAVKGLPSAIFGKNIEVTTFLSIEEANAYFEGWEAITKELSFIGFDEKEYIQRKNNQKIFDKLKSSK